ncbi:hypothetical protein PPERSA_03941 [Pseudocohnilembus persalinus]|uniref:Uncharacterized protein n=1 Tax=Pseudocohnilembus persalinus TaxID=266149 RepID=A0A0V0R5X4_PSEPJ|nr:hypothetical protein PPERSA_03941 [Pseudocohnilembus persalinus]|eukprot:KRX09879.1 hypothetical protein PPERSA_03941 [Pseudocohnilembus persalinus]
MQLDPIEPSFHSIQRSLSILSNNFSNFFFTKLLRRLILFLNQMFSPNSNSTRRNHLIPSINFAVRSPPSVPNLHNNFPSFFMHTLSNLFPPLYLFLIIYTPGPQKPVSHYVYRCTLRYYKPVRSPL